MTPAVQGVLMLAVGLVAVRLVVTNAYMNYLKASMGVWLLASAAVLVVVGIGSVVRAVMGRVDGGHGHDHPMTRAAWLLLLPAIALMVIPTDPLGAFAVDRLDTRRADAGPVDFGPLPDPTDGAVEIGLREFADRAYLDEDRALRGTKVRLTGFVTPADERAGAAFTLSRFVILCCAADAYPVAIDVHGVASPPLDSWVVVTGTWREPEGTLQPYIDPVELDAEELTRIQRPDNPYDPG